MQECKLEKILRPVRINAVAVGAGLLSAITCYAAYKFKIEYLFIGGMGLFGVSLAGYARSLVVYNNVSKHIKKNSSLPEVDLYSFRNRQGFFVAAQQAGQAKRAIKMIDQAHKAPETEWLPHY